MGQRGGQRPYPLRHLPVRRAEFLAARRACGSSRASCGRRRSGSAARLGCTHLRELLAAAGDHRLPDDRSAAAWREAAAAGEVDKPGATGWT